MPRPPVAGGGAGSDGARSEDREPGPAVLIVGGLLTSPWLYWKMRHDLLERGASRVAIAPVLGIHWLASAFVGLGSATSLVARAVDRLADVDSRPILVVGHSSGGILARLALAPRPFDGARRARPGAVGALVTLGTPHGATRVDGTLGREGMRAMRFLARYAAPPDATPTLSVGSEFDVTNDGGGGRMARRLRAELAASCYVALRGPAARRGPGDGMVPFEAAFLPGSRERRLRGIAHGPLAWIAPWYGSSAGLAQWWEEAFSMWSESLAPRNHVRDDPSHLQSPA